MSNNKDGLLDNIYDIKDLYLIKFQENYLKYLSLKDNMTIFHPDFYFIVEKFAINKKQTLNYNLEIYAECITCEDIYQRESQEEFNNIPPLFKEMFVVPKEYFTDLELQTGKVTSTRVFQIFQEYNLKYFSSTKVKKIGGKNARNS